MALSARASAQVVPEPYFVSVLSPYQTLERPVTAPLGAHPDTLSAKALVLAPPLADHTPGTWRLVMAGSLGSALGLVAGVNAAHGVAGGACAPNHTACRTSWATLGGFLGSVAGSALGAKLAASHDGRGPSFSSCLKGGLIGVIPGLFGAAVTVWASPPNAALIGFAVGQGAVASMYAAARTPRGN